MYTIIHPMLSGKVFEADGPEAVKNFSSDVALREYFLDELRQPLGEAKRLRTELLGSLPIEVERRSLRGPVEWFKTRLWENPGNSGKSVTLSNLIDSVDVEWRLSDNELNDKVSSVEVGRAIACVVLFQHSYLRGKQLWLIGGQEPSKRDLSGVAFEGGGTWNNRISSALSATLSPAQVLKWIAGQIF